MALTKVTSGGISDIAAAVEGASDSNKFTDADHSKLNAIEASATADQTKSDIEGLGIDVPAANLTGTIADARFPATLPTASAANLTAIPAANITGTLPAISGANLTGIEGVPTGVIAMWHGASSAIPSGWVICDGNNSTPNLTDKFIKSTGTANATGGSTNTGAHTLTIAEMPSHNHPIKRGSSGAGHYTVGNHITSYYGDSTISLSTGGGGSHTHTQSEPEYYSLIFIMKT